MHSLNRLDVLALMRRGLESEVKEAITEELVARHLASFEDELRSTLKEMLSKVTFERIESWENLLEARDEVQVSISIDGDVTPGMIPDPSYGRLR